MLGTSRIRQVANPKAGAPAGGPMVVYLFRCPAKCQYCLTVDRGGGNIPTAGGEAWGYVKELRLQSGERRVALDPDVALAELAQYGYYLVGEWYDAR